MRSDMSEVADRSPRRGPVRYQLDVIGADVADVVAASGGWLFDRVMAGWDVNVAVPAEYDDRPLQILGVRTVTLQQMLTEANASASSALAVSGRVCSADDTVRETVAAAVRAGRGEVMVWGDLWVTGLGTRGEQVRHQLSSAAQAFKAHAAATAGSDQVAVTSFETFLSHGRGCGTDYQDLRQHC